MQIEKQIDGINVVIEGTAVSEMVSIGSYEEQSEYSTRWIQEPEIVDAFDEDYNDVFLFPSQRKDIIDGLDINEFVI